MSHESDKKLKTSKSRRETAVQGTNDSSIVSKCSMAAQGYFDDPYLQNFVIKVTRRAPLIHRGYYMRAKTIDFLVKKFLHSHSSPKQIISLGAGFDSAFFRLTAEELLRDTVYCEVDFPEVVKRKHALIKMNDVLSGMICEEQEGKEKSLHIELSSKNYKLLGVDLSQLNTLEAALKLCGVDFDVPTLFLSEVVLTYMTRRCSSAVIKWAGETFSDSVFIMYEQINPNDAFGLFMQNHFKTIGSPLKCINTFPTIQSQIDRFRKLGWDDCEAVDMNTFYSNIVVGAEQDRIENIEPFDEYEEFHLKCSHYMMLCAYKGDRQPRLLDHFKGHADNVTDDPEILLHENCIKLTPVKSANPFYRFGHVTSSIGSDWLMSAGGFGEQNGKHMRVTAVTVANSETLESFTFDPKVNNKDVEVNRMHATASLLQDGTILLIGGRLSPMRLCTQMVALKWNSGISELEHLLQLLKVEQNEKDLKTKHKHGVQKQTKTSSEENRPVNHNVGGSNADHKPLDEEQAICDNCSSCDTNNLNCVQNYVKNDEIVCQDSDKESRHVENKVSDIHEGNTCVKENLSKTVPVKENVSKSVQVNRANTPKGDRTDGLLECYVLKQEGEVPCPRWRHSAITVQLSGKERIILFGGRTQDKLALEDCYSFDTQTNVWTKVHCSGASPSGRHSHSASLWNGHMIIAGGLGDDLHPLNSVHMLNLETYTWSQLPCKMPARYSHTAHVIKDFLVLVGGVGFSHRVLGVTVIHLPSGQCAEFPLPVANKDELIILHGHTGVAIDDHRILLLGGGGNCFSFGTHLNSSPILMDLTEALQMIGDTWNYS